MYKRMLRSALAASFVAALSLGALGSGDIAWGVKVTAAPGDIAWTAPTAVPGDIAWTAPADTVA
ncbi:hypothetical protein ACIOHB_24960 [Streptomyces microflavus]|uniref:hypothetical protein n=1 Tax=Streptomyces TaxID=1883 RepID=UPI0008239388|nr:MULTISPECIES: hypothetical protein [Streptomyces]WSA61630.1 hypothetical protein OHB31_16320 [Streptomyces microflavus]SCK42990.1 hypothetical protein YUYDRAFT_05357 [Streptomyces sp. ScaeMP-e48]